MNALQESINFWKTEFVFFTECTEAFMSWVCQVTHSGRHKLDARCYSLHIAAKS